MSNLFLGIYTKIVKLSAVKLKSVENHGIIK